MVDIPTMTDGVSRAGVELDALNGVPREPGVREAFESLVINLRRAEPELGVRPPRQLREAIEPDESKPLLNLGVAVDGVEVLLLRTRAELEMPPPLEVVPIEIGTP